MFDINYVKNYVENNTNCKLISTEYINAREIMKFTCEICGKEFETTFYSFKNQNKHHCNECGTKDSLKKIQEKMSHSYEYVYNYIKEKGCELISDTYINNKQELKVKCGNCGEIFTTTFKVIKSTKKLRCKNCIYKDYKNNSITKFSIQDINNFVTKNSNCKLLSKEYHHLDEELDFICECGNIFKMSFKKFKYREKRKCPDCNFLIKFSRKWNIETIKKYVEDNSDCELISDEYKSTEKLKFKCGKCGKTFTSTFNAFRRKKIKACPSCNRAVSAGERKLMKLLDDYKIKYIPQYTFDDCKFECKLRFDFFLPEFNTLIEVDGIQHIKPIEKFGGEEEFEKTIIKDEIKNNYCKNNNIQLIRIAYDDKQEIKYFVNHCKLIIEKQILTTKLKLN